MAKKRARLSDRDPLNLNNFNETSQQSSQSTSQPDTPLEYSENQEADKLTGESSEPDIQVDQLTSQKASNLLSHNEDMTAITKPEANLLTGQKVNQSTSEKVSKLNSQLDKNIASHKENMTNTPELQADNSTIQEVSKLDGHQDNSETKESILYQVDNPTSQTETLSTIEVKKATFQIDKAVLTKLERFVLSLQLELGKENAPYKEVIVEEAIERLLGLDQAKLLKALKRRQSKRKN